MLSEIIEHGAELRWLCGSVFGLVGATATNISQRRNMVNIIRHASTWSSPSPTIYSAIHFATTRVLGIAPQAVYRTRYRSSEGMRHIALQLYMSAMERLSASLQTHFLTSQLKRGQVCQGCFCSQWMSFEADVVSDIYGNKYHNGRGGLQKDPKAYLRYSDDAEIVGLIISFSTTSPQH